MGATVSVLGASGFAGGEILRILITHPGLQVTVVAGGDAAGAQVNEVHPHLSAAGLSILTPLPAALGRETDVCFSCLPHGVLDAQTTEPAAALTVDLSQDHRNHPDWVYGLPEFARSALSDATKIANPGCYPTASLLATVPFARKALISSPIVIDALSGTSGAGRNASHGFSELHGDFAAYGDVAHRHVPEIEQNLGELAGRSFTVSFTPHLIPVARGLLVTARAPLQADIDAAGAIEVLRDAYRDEAFVRVTEDWPHVKWVAGSNGAIVSARVDDRAGMLIMSAAIDNLGKGAAGQAIQNANIALGFDEGAGLSGVGLWP